MWVEGRTSAEGLQLPALAFSATNCTETDPGDIWDPRNWKDEEHEYRIYGDDRASIWAVVDEEDYQWAIQWLWSPKWSRGGRKVYLRRVGHEGTRQSRTQRTIWLHTEIMKRTGIEPPSPLHTLVDHRDGNSLNCRRNNLRWATVGMNARNRNGLVAHDLVEG